MNALSETPISEISKVVREVANGGEPVMVRDGGTVAAVISLEEFQRFKALEERERDGLQRWLGARLSAQWRAASAALGRLEALAGRLPVPAATEGDGGAAVLVWSSKELVLELEFEAGAASWYARERAAPSGQGGVLIVDAPTPELLGWLARVRRA